MYGLIMLLKSSNFIEHISPGDIRSSKELIKEYNKIWMEENIDLDFPNQAYIINDFANYLIATQQTYSNSFYHIFFRHYMINSKKDVVRYMRWLDTIPLDTQINIYWSLLQPDERDEFINNPFP
jgi:hypothetical protein